MSDDIENGSESNSAAVAENEVPSSNNKTKAASGAKRVWMKGRKRPAEPLSEAEAAEATIKRIRQRLASTPRSAINASMIINEYRKGLNYEIVGQSGPVHSPVYTIRLAIDDQVFEGTGSSKKKAKLVAAEAALHAIFGDILPPPDVVTTSDQQTVEKPEEIDKTVFETVVHGTNPTLVLNRLRQGTSYEDVDPMQTDSSTSAADLTAAAIFRVSCVVDGVTYVGSGSTKKMAKAHAAAEALEKVFGISCTQTSSGFPLFVGELPEAELKRKVSEPKQRKQSSVDSATPQLLCSLPGQKNPVMFIHELYPTVDYTISETADDDGLFHASVPIEGKTFEGNGTSKKAARSAAAILAVNFLHQTGYMNMRLAEKASQKKPKWQPQSRAQFTQNNTAQFRGQFSGRRGRGVGRRGAAAVAGRGQMQYGGGNNDTSWVAGGVLKAGDFVGISSEQEYLQQSGFSTDDSFTTANSSFGFSSPYSQQFGGVSQQTSPANVTSGSFGSNSNVLRRGRGTGSTPSSTGSSRGRGRGREDEASNQQFNQGFGQGLQKSNPIGFGNTRSGFGTKTNTSGFGTNAGGLGATASGVGGASSSIAAGGGVKKLMDVYFKGSKASYGQGTNVGQSSVENSASPLASGIGNTTGLASAEQLSEYETNSFALTQSTAPAYAGYDYAYKSYGTYEHRFGGDADCYGDYSQQYYSQPAYPSEYGGNF